MDIFYPEICEKLRYYVYRLVDPRTNETFYVGKGKDNRVFSHALGNEQQIEKLQKDILPLKLERISELEEQGKSVHHVIHRHGLDEDTAFEVEAALIDAYPDLANQVSGHGSGDRGAEDAEIIRAKYQAEEAVFKHNTFLVSINRTATDFEKSDDYIGAAQFAWPVDKRRIQGIDYVMAVRDRLIVGVFEAEHWLDATRENFPEHGKDVPGRLGFKGCLAPDEIRKYYRLKRLPADCIFNQTGVRYWPDPPITKK